MPVRPSMLRFNMVRRDRLGIRGDRGHGRIVARTHRAIHDRELRRRRSSGEICRTPSGANRPDRDDRYARRRSHGDGVPTASDLPAIRPAVFPVSLLQFPSLCRVGSFRRAAGCPSPSSTDRVADSITLSTAWHRSPQDRRGQRGRRRGRLDSLRSQSDRRLLLRSDSSGEHHPHSERRCPQPAHGVASRISRSIS